MSKYHRIETKFKNEETLIQALADCGIQVERGEALTLYGYEGDARPETAEIVIRRRHISSMANDVGFHRLADGSFEVIISEYDQTARAAQMVKQVKQRYARLEVERLACLRGMRVEEVHDNGAIRLRLYPQTQRQTARQYVRG
jgi:hypothetical protein